MKQWLHRLSEAALSACCRQAGLIRTLQRRSVGRLAVYHNLADEADPLFGLSTSVFARQMRFLAGAYRVVALDELADMAEGRRPWLERAVALTFDDGYEDNYLVAFPILRELGLPATIYLTSDYIGAEEPLWLNRLFLAALDTPLGALDLPPPLAAEFGRLPLGRASARRASARALVNRLYDLPPSARRPLAAELAAALEAGAPRPARRPSLLRMLNWRQVREMADSGLVTFGSHGCSHSIMSRLDEGTLREEVTASKAAIERELGRPVLHFAYPNGTRGDWDARAVRLLQDAGYRAAVISCAGLVQSGSDLFELPRVGYGGAHEATFAKRLENVSFREAARLLLARRRPGVG